MTDLPRRPIRPLPPPAGSFEQAVARGRVRRRRALAGVASAGLAAVAVVAIVGASAIGHVGAQRDLRPAVPVVSSPPPSSAPASKSPPPASASPTPVLPSPTAPVVVSSAPVSPSVVASSAPPTSAPPTPATYHGRLTDAAGHPLKGYDLYWDSPGVVTAADAPDELNVDHPAAATRADGTFDVACEMASSSLLAISAKQIPHDAQSWLYSPIGNQPDNEVGVAYTGGISILPAINVTHGCDAGAARSTTIYRPHAVVTGTLSIDGKPYGAADAARDATAQPGDPGSDLTLFVEINSPNGEIQMDGVLPDPGNGVFTLSGLGTGDVVFRVANSSVSLPVVDGQSVKVAVSITTGTLPTGGDATVNATVVP